MHGAGNWQGHKWKLLQDEVHSGAQHTREKEEEEEEEEEEENKEKIDDRENDGEETDAGCRGKRGSFHSFDRNGLNATKTGCLRQTLMALRPHDDI